MARKSPAKPVKSKKWVKKKVLKGKKKKRKLGGWWLIANIVSFGLVIGTAVVIFFGDGPGNKPGDRPVDKPVDKESRSLKESTSKSLPVISEEVTLYFGSPDGESLLGRTVTVTKAGLSDEISGAVELLLKGPDNTEVRRKKRVERTVPIGTRLLGVRVTGNTAVVNLSKEVVDNHDGGTAGEMQTIYSIVNTVALGWPEIRDVQLLIEGRRIETIAGHIDIKLPIRPDRTVNAD